jgi:hypothetical protein
MRINGELVVATLLDSGQDKPESPSPTGGAGRQGSKQTSSIRAGRSSPGLLTQREVATLLGISTRAVRGIERRAVNKLRQHPALRRLWQEWTGGTPPFVEEAACDLSREEVVALASLARTPEERSVLLKVFVVAWTFGA